MEKAIDLLLSNGLPSVLLVIVGIGYWRQQQKTERNYERHAEDLRVLNEAHKKQLEELSERFAEKASKAIEKSTELGVRVTSVLEAIARQNERRRP